jgi:Predicted pPIWI-associating nuclease
MADALTALDQVNAQIAALRRAANSGRSKYLGVSDAQPIARAVATIYFESVRADLDAVKSRPGLVEEIDFVMQSILQLASEQSEKLAYIGQMNELRPYLLEASVDLMKARGSARLVLSQTERGILDALAALLPSCAASYEQALRDIAQGGRVSWRGTATELRETFREVMDRLAPDDKVSAAPGFRLEADQTKPTQKQKVRYILRARRSSSASVTVAETSLDAVDEAVAVLARSTYQRGSVSTHVGTTGTEIRNLKRYVDALLAELLEVS